MARSVCSATTLGCNWVTIALNSSTHNVKSRRKAAAKFIHTIPTFRLLGLRMSKAAPRLDEMPVLAGNKEPSGWSDEELRVVQSDLEGDGLPPRWIDEVPEEDVKLLTKFRSRYNLVQVMEVSRLADSVLAGSRVLTLDRPGNIHSLHYRFKILTGCYYDAFATLPPLVPEGPIGILGLGAGTTARIVHHFWPGLEMHGWELDASVVGVGRRYFDMQDLEAGKPSDLPFAQEEDGGDEREEDCLAQDSRRETGKLVVHVGDALDPGAAVEGGFAGICVDLYSEGKVVAGLQEVSTWEMLKERLKDGGRIMVNCGGSCVEAEDCKSGNATMRETLSALMEAFPGEVCTRTFYPDDNCMAMTGVFPDVKEWKRKLPRCLKVGVSDWKLMPC